MTSSSKYFTAGCLLFTLAIPLANAAVITTADGVNGADARIRRGASTQNFGQETFLSAHNGAGTSRWEKSLFRFDLGSLNPVSISDVTLTLTYIGNAGGGSLGANNASMTFNFAVYGLLNSHSGNTWVEGNGGTDNIPVGEINWNTAPGHNTGSGSGVLSAATYNSGAALATFSIVGAGTVGTQFNLNSTALTSFLQSDTDGLATFILVQTTTFASDITSGVDANTYDHSFATKEHATYAEPTLNVTTVPEPSTLGLILAGWLTFFLRRARRGSW